ncbi:MAG: hypothetical protein J6Q05_06100 [Elusimicrobiaceae bacterium]|nr:hypothetical protein [Elusimicrobiaceae bacterium]
MKLEFKFSLVNFIAFAALGGLFYWLCPLPANPVARTVVCGAVGLVLFGMCFVVVSHRGFIRPASPEVFAKKNKKHKK